MSFDDLKNIADNAVMDDNKFTYNFIFNTLTKELSLFLNEEKGNKITSYSMEGLIHRIMNSFDDSKEK